MLLDILELLQYLDKSPLGSLGFDQLNAFDFVFVLVDSTKVKLVDLDNLRSWEKPCQADSDCTIEEMPRKGKTMSHIRIVHKKNKVFTFCLLGFQTTCRFVSKWTMLSKKMDFSDALISCRLHHCLYM